MSLRAAVLLLASVAAPVLAQEVSRSPVPPPNPAIVATAAPVLPADPAGLALSLRPRPRPGAIAALSNTVAEAQTPRPFLGGLFRPRPRPADTLTDKAEDPPARTRPRATRKGSVCGVPDIRGEALAPITSRVTGCGVAEPVRVTAVSGVTLSQAASIDCDTARALNTWVADVVQPAFGRNEVVELQVAAHYICRGRNNKRGAKVSEHGRGRAIDISAFQLADGTVLTVAADYDRTLRRVHDKACGIFGTTLGPGSDGYHEDHLHLDTARHRNGPYCR